MSICQLTPCEPEWKMWRAVCVVLVLVHIASSQPVTTDEEESARQTRQLNFGECCPCPDGNVESSFRNNDRWFPKNGRNVAVPFGNPNEGQFVNDNGLGSFRSGVDDCPCRFRGADSEGSSSIFFPSAFRPSDAKSESKEDPKNLLEPEVGLASSVLETLREATDEEYRDALARDSARARAADDATPEESAQNIVTIILPSQDDEDVTSESHLQSPRCIHPLGRSLSRMRAPVKKTPNVVTEIFMLPKKKPVGLLHRGGEDMDSNVEASNTQEHIVDTNTENKRLKTKPVLLQNEEDDVCQTNPRKSSTLKSVPVLGMEKEAIGHDKALKKLNKSKIKTDARSKDTCSAPDLTLAASDAKELFANPGIRLNPLGSENNPLNLKNFLKLRDVELLPPGQLIEKLKLGSPPLQLPPLIEKMPKLSDLLKNGIKFNLNKNGQWNNAKHDGDSLEESTSNSNIQVIPRDKTLTTEILDALPSSSNVIEMKDDCNVDTESLIDPQSEAEAKISSEERNNDNTLNNLGKKANIIENGSQLISDSNESAVSNELISSESHNDLPTTNAENQENTHIEIQSGENGQESEASNCLETLQNEEKSWESNDETTTSKDTEFNSDIVEQNSVETVPSAQEIQPQNGKTILKKAKESPSDKSLLSVREGILKRIEDRKRTTLFRKEGKIKNFPQKPDVQRTTKDCLNEDTRNISPTLASVSKINSGKRRTPLTSNAVELEDLQKLSDTLLKQSLSNEKEGSLDENNDDNVDTNLSGLTDRADKLLDDIREPTIDSDTANNNDFVTISENPSSRNAKIQKDDNIDKISDEDDTCTSSERLKDAMTSLRRGPDVNEMAAEASEPVVTTKLHDPLQLFKNTQLGLPLFQNVIVEPSSLFDGISTPSFDLRGALNLPTLDDIRERLANVFGTKTKDSIDDDFDCSNDNPIMAAEPSISNLISKSPVFPLEDLNLDIFQLKPLTMAKSSKKTPGLNLKSFRTKVPVPKNLDLKPLRLQSTVGNDGGLLGATLTLGKNAKEPPKLFETLGNSLQNLPSIDDMMTKMRANVENLVNPLDLTPHSIPSISDLSSNLRSNAENTIKALQGRMGSTLGSANNLLSNARNPHELLDRIADAREDLGAKLKGIHYDLNDRLDNIFDQSVLSSLNPMLKGDGLHRNVLQNRNTGFKSVSMPVSKKHYMGGKKESMGKSASFRNKISGERKINSVPPQRKFKMPAAASVPVPKTVEVPKLKSMLDKSLSSPKNDLTMKSIASRTNPLSLENKLNKNGLGIKASSLKENKVKVTFGSTTPVPISSSRSQQRTNTNFDKRINEGLGSNNQLGRRFGFKSKSNADPHESPSELQPSVLRSPLTSDSRQCNDDVNTLEERNGQQHSLEDQRNIMRATPKPRNNLKSKSGNSDFKSATDNEPSSKNPLALPSWPKIADSSFLSKVREAVKARLSSFDPVKALSNIPKAATPSSDMERSASENTDIVVGDTLKENVSYKCRMVCTKT